MIWGIASRYTFSNLVIKFYMLFYRNRNEAFKQEKEIEDMGENLGCHFNGGVIFGTVPFDDRFAQI